MVLLVGGSGQPSWGQGLERLTLHYRVNVGLKGNPLAIDVDGDGSDEIALLSREFFVYFRNLGAGDFLATPAGIDLPPKRELTLPQVVDVDADGDEDVMVVQVVGNWQYATHQLWLLENHGDEGFRVKVMGGLIRGYGDHKWHDVDGDGDRDGDRDLIYLRHPSRRGEGDYRVQVYLNAGGNELELHQELPGAADAMAVLDIDRDKIRKR